MMTAFKITSKQDALSHLLALHTLNHAVQDTINQELTRVAEIPDNPEKVQKAQDLQIAMHRTLSQIQIIAQYILDQSDKTTGSAP